MNTLFHYSHSDTWLQRVDDGEFSMGVSVPVFQNWQVLVCVLIKFPQKVTQDKNTTDKEGIVAGI